MVMFNKIAFIFLLSIKFINCDKFDFKQLKLHGEKGSNFVNHKIKTLQSERNVRQLLFNQFLPPIPPFSIHFGNTRPVQDKPVQLFNFPLPNFQFGQNPIQQQTSPQTQEDVNKDKRPKPEYSGNKRKKPESVEDKPRPSLQYQQTSPQIKPNENKDKRPKPDNSGNKRKKPEPVEDKPAPLLNFPKPIEANFDEFNQQTSPQTQVDVNKNKSPEPVEDTLAPLLNFPKPISQFDNNKPIDHIFDEFFQPTTSKTQDKKETKKPSNLDQKIDSTKITNLPKVTLNLNKTKSSSDNIFFEDDETTENTPILILSTTPAIYSTTHKRIIPGLPSPEDDGDYNEDDKISNSALLSLVG